MADMAERVHQQMRNNALVTAERDRAAAVRDAEIEYSETVVKLQEWFELELAQARSRRKARVLPAHRAYNAAVIAAEEAHAVAVRIRAFGA